MFVLPSGKFFVKSAGDSIELWNDLMMLISLDRYSTDAFYVALEEVLSNPELDSKDTALACFWFGFLYGKQR